MDRFQLLTLSIGVCIIIFAATAIEDESWKNNDNLFGRMNNHPTPAASITENRLPRLCEGITMPYPFMKGDINVSC